MTPTLPRRLITFPAALMTFILVVLGVQLGASEEKIGWNMYPSFVAEETALSLLPNADPQATETQLNFDLKAPADGKDKTQADLLKLLEEKQVAAGLFTETSNYRSHAYAIYDPSRQLPWLKNFDLTPGTERKAILVSGSACDMLWQESNKACDVIPEHTEILGSVDAPQDNWGNTQYLLIPATSDPVFQGTLIFNEKSKEVVSEATDLLENSGYSVTKVGTFFYQEVAVFLQFSLILLIGLLVALFFYWRKTTTQLGTRLARSKITSGALIGWVVGGIITYLHYSESAGEKIFLAAVSFILMVVILQLIYPKTESQKPMVSALSWVSLGVAGLVFIGAAASLASFADGPRTYYHKGSIHEVLSEKNPAYFDDVVGPRESESRPTEALETLAALIEQDKAYAVGSEDIKPEQSNDPGAEIRDDYMSRPHTQFYLLGDKIREVQADTQLCDPAPCAMSGDEVRIMPNYLEIAGHNFDLTAAPNNAKGSIFAADRSYQSIDHALLVRLPAEDIAALHDEAARAVLLGTVFTGASNAEINEIIQQAATAGVILSQEHYQDVNHRIYTPTKILSHPSLWLRIAAMALLGMMFFTIARGLIARENIHPMLSVVGVIIVGIIIPTIIAPWSSLFMNGEDWAVLVYPCAIVGALVLMGILLGAARGMPLKSSR
ncbi:hypothetical protein [Corynebacterium spheniscorum]|uniref:Uncharacterized protein n=1 Tax=Corynebacterium spheniscorum TaxID=185761 RepID=A0A1I2TP35_9CORY|nr:hypothetical protein [Corynebacterium spheniscorum]KAA8724309.1 hypothetical protein F4V56_00705 [Corynebacterium spheniscorum]SFG66668.1 hypothetical protein SAMN05660282_01568 [Corynebacterium spheniscorum]